MKVWVRLPETGQRLKARQTDASRGENVLSQSIGEWMSLLRVSKSDKRCVFGVRANRMAIGLGLVPLIGLALAQQTAPPASARR